MARRWTILAVLLLSLAAMAQQRTEEEPQRTRTPNRTDIDLGKGEKSSESIIPQPQLLEQAFEGAIDSTRYILGPGDQLLVKIWGILDEQFVVPVTPEGYVVIPQVAEVQVSGRTLAEGSAALKRALRQSFRNAAFSIRLVRLRKFRVAVLGEVENPGTYFLRAVDRVSDAIQLAGGLSNWGNDTQVELYRGEGDTATINLSDFFLHGDKGANPVLNGGDVVFVPPIDLDENYVIVEGNVGSEGLYPIRDAEPLFTFLTRIRAINRRSDIDRIVLVRGGERRVVSLLGEDRAVRNLALATGDRIIVPTNRNQVYVRGEVIQPGALPYLANYMAQDYAGQAGLLETSRTLKDLYVIRAGSGEIARGPDVIVQNGDIVVVPRKTRETFKDYLTILTPIISIAISAIALINTTN